MVPVYVITVIYCSVLRPVKNPMKPVYRKTLEVEPVSRTPQSAQLSHRWRKSSTSRTLLLEQ